MSPVTIQECQNFTRQILKPFLIKSMKIRFLFHRSKMIHLSEMIQRLNRYINNDLQSHSNNPSFDRLCAASVTDRDKTVISNVGVFWENSRDMDNILNQLKR